MKKIFFYANIQSHDESVGITKKVRNQVSALRGMGYEVYYSAYTETGMVIFNNEDHIVYERDYKFISDRLRKLYRRWDLIKFVIDFLSKTNILFDYAYLRYHHFDRVYTKLLKTIKRNKKTKVIIEAHGFPLREFKITRLLPIHLIDFFYERHARKYINLVAAISDVQDIWGCKTIQIDNAIDLNKIPVKPGNKKKDNILRIISVSNEMKYHGYPKLIKGLNIYYQEGGTEKIELHFVGEFRQKTKELVEKFNIKDKVIFHGKKFGEELDVLYNNADLGIGALAPRAGAEHGSSIKTKEYFAKGLPFINGWKEYAFDDNYPYVKRFPLDNEIIDMNEVLEFYKSIKDDKDLSENMRMFAEEHYTWESQFTKVFSKV